jgi:hypothetical protein
MVQKNLTTYVDPISFTPSTTEGFKDAISTMKEYYHGMEVEEGIWPRTMSLCIAKVPLDSKPITSYIDFPKMSVIIYLPSIENH